MFPSKYALQVKLLSDPMLKTVHTFRHSYRSWLDETGAPLTVQKLMRHASIQTTMNIYGKAMTDSKRQAHSKVVEMVLNSGKSSEKPLISAIGS
ncbi:MAG: tyrosine-type recombinase/integrase [Acidobacteriota bacterium]|nr:tyrosine-type recombinase/integrase [Acidobacteriota bacterium]